MRNLSGLLCGVLFGLGLAISGMTDTDKVRGFLDVFGQWIPDLLFVMGGAVAVTTLGFYVILKKGKPIYDKAFHTTTRKTVDRRLIIGAAMFGVGWGLYGYCPGPAIASLAYLNPTALVFVGFMYAGMRVADIVLANDSL